jgi:MobA/MobL family
MAICFIRANIISRSNGSSAVAAAAYRSGEKLLDEATNKTHNYTKKTGVHHSEILAPIEATTGNEWLNDREALWNKVTAAEKRDDAQLSRELIVAIPRELDPLNQVALVREYIQNSYVDRGMIADINLHHLDGDNPHAHVMLTMRELQIDEMGIASFGNKDRSWNDKKLLKTQLKEWEIVANKYLENAKVVERIDSRSYAEQGVARIPQIHLGKDVTAMRRRGVPTERGDIYDQIDQANEDIRANLEQIYESSSAIDQIKKEAAAAQKREADERVECARKLVEAEIQQRQEAERQRVELQIQRQNDLRDRERQEKLEREKLLQHVKDRAEQDTIEFLRNARPKFTEIADTSKNLRESKIEALPEVKKEIEPEEPKFTIPFMIEAFTHMVEQYPKGQKCEIFKVTGNFLARGIKDVPDSRLELERMMRRILDYGGREHTPMIPLSMVVDELKLARDNPIAKVKTKTQIKTTRSKDIDYSESKSQSQDQGYSI